MSGATSPPPAAARLDEAVAFLRDRIGRPPTVALVLGSGLGGVADTLADAVRIPFRDIPGFAAPTVEGHHGAVVAGALAGVPCVALQGRLHVYEGHAPAVLAFPVRALVRLGVRALVVTNAAGGINRSFRAGDVMVMDDHINLLWRNPLIGAVVPGETRFPDMAAPYDPGLQRLAEQAALACGVRTVRGVYCAVTGPSYETPAEIRMLARLGADAVGMSTVPEALVARALGVPVLGLSLISNLAAGIATAPLSHEEVMEAGALAATGLSALLREVVAGIHAARTGT